MHEVNVATFKLQPDSTTLIKTLSTKRLATVYSAVCCRRIEFITCLHLSMYAFSKLVSTYTRMWHEKKSDFPLVNVSTCQKLPTTSKVVFPTVPESVETLSWLLPDNSSRPPTRIQAATLKRNKKATWQRFLHSLHFLRGSHGISMFSLLFVSSK